MIISTALYVAQTVLVIFFVSLFWEDNEKNVFLPFMFKSWFEDYIFSNIHMAFCALAMCCLTYASFSNPANIAFLCFVFGATLCSYGAHWYLSQNEKIDNPRMSWLNKNINKLLIISSLGGLVAFFSFLTLTSFWLEIVLIGLLTFLYTAPKIPLSPFIYLKGYAFAKTLYLAFAWTYVTVFLPLQINHFFINQSLKASFFVQASSLYGLVVFIYIFQICMLFDYRDREDDSKLHIRNLITYLNASAFRMLFIALAFLHFFVLYVLYCQGFSTKILVVFALSEGLLCLQLPYAMRTKNDYYYYFVLDSMMLMPSFFYFL